MCPGLFPWLRHFLWCAAMVWSPWFCGAGAAGVLRGGLLIKACSFPSDVRSGWGSEIESCYVGSKKESRLWTVFRENITDKEFPYGALNGILYFRASLGEGAGVEGEAASGVQGPTFISGFTYIFMYNSFFFFTCMIWKWVKFLKLLR